MPTIVIDTARVQDAVETRLQEGLAGSGVAFVPIGEDPPADAGAWARLVAIDWAEGDRDTQPGNVDAWSIVATIAVRTTNAKANAHAHAAALEVVRRCFDSLVVTLADAVVEFHRAVPAADTDPRMSRRERAGAVIARGRATRTTGSAAQNYL